MSFLKNRWLFFSLVAWHGETHVIGKTTFVLIRLPGLSFHLLFSVEPSWIGRGVFFYFIVIGASWTCIEVGQSGHLVCHFLSLKASLCHSEVKENKDGASMDYRSGGEACSREQDCCFEKAVKSIFTPVTDSWAISIKTPVQYFESPHTKEF